MKIKYNKIINESDLTDGGIRSEYRIKGKTYLVLALKYTERGADALVISDYLNLPCWVPFLGAEVVDGYIPEYWIRTYYTTDYEDGLYFLPPSFDFKEFYEDYPFESRTFLNLAVQEYKEIERLTKEKDIQRKKLRMERLKAGKNPLEIGNKIAEYMDVEPTKKQLHLIANDIEKYLTKYDYDIWLWFPEGIRQRCMSDYDELQLAKEILTQYGGMGTFNDVGLPDKRGISEEELRKDSDQFSLLRTKLYVCCRAIVAKHTYMDLFHE